MIDLLLASAIGLQTPPPIVLAQSSPNWQFITDAKYRRFRTMIVDPNPHDMIGSRITQQQVSALFGSPVACDGDTYMRFCTWREKHGLHKREISVTWKVSDKSVITWDASGDLPF